jgi:hypothetical protein
VLCVKVYSFNVYCLCQIAAILLQEEVTVAMQYYQQLLGCATGHSISGSSSAADAAAGSVAAAAAKFISPEKCTKPIRDAYFACLEDFIKNCMASSDHLRPPSTAAAAAADADDSPGKAQQQQQQRRPAMSAAAAAAILGRESWDDTAVEAEGTFDVTLSAGGSAAVAAAMAAAGGGVGGGGGAAGDVLRLVLSDYVKLLLIGSNLSFMREKLVGSLTQRFLLTLTGMYWRKAHACVCVWGGGSSRREGGGRGVVFVADVDDGKEAGGQLDAALPAHVDRYVLERCLRGGGACVLRGGGGQI